MEIVRFLLEKFAKIAKTFSLAYPKAFANLHLRIFPDLWRGMTEMAKQMFIMADNSIQWARLEQEFEGLVNRVENNIRYNVRTRH